MLDLCAVLSGFRFFSPYAVSHLWPFMTLDKASETDVSVGCFWQAVYIILSLEFKHAHPH
jgi:hypothetical protein